MKTKDTIYTKEFISKELNDMVNELFEDRGIYLLGDLFETRSYHANRFSEWARKYKEDKEISCTIKRIKDILEHRLNKNGLENKINATMAIFNLKNNYDWKDKTEQEIDVKGAPDLTWNVNVITPGDK